MHFESYDSGASNPTLNRNHIHLLPVRYPLPPTQRKVAAILSAYDELIENNARRIAILEEMAQALYREWFVHFRFPGHEEVPMVESALGPVPEGWMVQPVGTVMGTLGGGTPSTKEAAYWNPGEITWFSPSDLTAAGTMFINESGKKISRAGLARSSARLFPAYSVMMTSRATIGVVAINTQEASTNQGFITLIPTERASVYQLYFWLAENRARILSLASGATFKEISRSTFRQIPIVLADALTCRRFRDVVEPIGEQIIRLQAKNDNLRRTRDLLLPKLISGELDVENLDIATVEASV